MLFSDSFAPTCDVCIIMLLILIAKKPLHHGIMVKKTCMDCQKAAYLQKLEVTVTTDTEGEIEKKEHQ